jgi:hypothetical protein
LEAINVFPVQTQGMSETAFENVNKQKSGKLLQHKNHHNVKAIRKRFVKSSNQASEGKHVSEKRVGIMTILIGLLCSDWRKNTEQELKYLLVSSKGMTACCNLLKLAGYQVFCLLIPTMFQQLILFLQFNFDSNIFVAVDQSLQTITKVVFPFVLFPFFTISILSRKCHSSIFSDFRHMMTRDRQSFITQFFPPLFSRSFAI